ncbi:MAG: FAD-dependent monooxygenase [Synechococcaceae cyanobacterium]|nr:FAD-dependent monooxygenase [Synechococcaceae cyanobacterium]
MSSPAAPLIVGAGPAGLALALTLARRGLPVTLVEAQPRAHRLFRGEALMPSGLQALQALDLQPAAGVPSRRLTGWTFQLERRVLFDWREPAAPEPACTLIDQAALLRHWRDQALALPELTLIEAVAVSDLLTRRERVVGVQLADGRRLASDLVIACDGRQSLLRRRSGLDCAGGAAPFELLWFLLQGPEADALAETLAGRFLTVLGAGGSFALFGRAAGGVQLGWVQHPGEEPPPQPEAWPQRWAAQAAEPLASRLAAIPATAIEGPQRLALAVGCAERWQRPGLLLLGDAAHPMSPLRAQGLNMALRDAVVAAHHLLPCLQRPGWGGLDTALQRIGCVRQEEIRRIQALQHREATLALLLHRLPLLRRRLAAASGWLGPRLAPRWAASQQTLRRGVLALPPLD